MVLRCRQAILIFMLFFIGCSKKEINNEPIQSVTVSNGDFLDDWTFSVNPQLVNLELAQFRLWIPSTVDVSDLKAILVLSRHYNGNGLGMPNSVSWQNFAIKNKIGLLGVYFKSNGFAAFDTYADASSGSGRALLIALEAIAEKNNISEIASLPFLLRGYSAGGMFSYSFSAYKPERVIAFANIRGWSVTHTSDENKGIPGLFLIAQFEEPSKGIGIMKNIVMNKRINDGLWSYALEPNVDHFGGLTKSDELIKQFFTSALSFRLTEGTNELQEIPHMSGWLGNNDSKDIYAYDDYPNEKSESSWLIDENFAIKWKDYQ